MWANKGIYVSYGRHCVTNPVGHTHMLYNGCTRTGFTGLCSLCGCSLISFVAYATCRCTTKGHPGSLSCKQGQYIHGDLSKVPFAGCLHVTVVPMLLWTKHQAGRRLHETISTNGQCLQNAVLLKSYLELPSSRYWVDFKILVWNYWYW